jgi:membrane-associated HD superfamily phosphohydrolase
MTQVTRVKKLDKTVAWLFVIALAIEVVGTLISFKLGTEVANQCPRTSNQQMGPIIVSALSIITIVAAIIKSKNTLITLYGIFFVALIVGWGCVLWLVASGSIGINWCNYHW